MEDEIAELKNLLTQVLAELRASNEFFGVYKTPQPNKTAQLTLPIVDSLPQFGIVDRFKVTLSQCSGMDELIMLAHWLHSSQEGRSLQEVPETYKWVLEQIQRSVEVTALDLGDVLARTDVEMRRLGMTPVQGRQYLASAYHRRSRQELDGGQLTDFLGYLMAQPGTLAL